MRVRAGEIEALSLDVLIRGGTLAELALPVAKAIARAEAEGNAVCGLFYLPIFASHLACGKVDGQASPQVEADGAAVRVDARHGFAHPAIAAGHPALIDAARQYGIAAMTVTRSYNALALAHHLTPLIEAGLIGLCVSNAPASVAPPGATKPLFGTNPIALGVPMVSGRPIIVDQSLSAVTKTAMKIKAAAGEPIPEGWAQDRDGRPTTDPATGLAGALLPAGGQKGANLSLLVEILAACLSGSSLSNEASPLGDDTGGPPDLGQFQLAIDPQKFGGEAFSATLARLAEAMGGAGARLPGQRLLWGAFQDTSVEVDDALWQRCVALREQPQAAAR